MHKLQDISTLSADVIDLLEAVGYLDVSDLLEADKEKLQAELFLANEKLKIVDHSPSVDEVVRWQEVVANHCSLEVKGASLHEADEEKVAVSTQAAVIDFENDSEVQEMLQSCPAAVPLDPALIRRHDLKVADIAEGVLLTNCEGDVEVNLAVREPLSKEQQREEKAARKGLQLSRIRSFDEIDGAPEHIKPLERGEPKEVVVPSQNVNEGVSPESRRFVRGVLHHTPWRVRLGAFTAVSTILVFVVNVMGIPALLYYEHVSGLTMLSWVVGLFVSLVVSALCYIVFGLRARCCVCGQRAFVSKQCLKHRKAHRMALLGYVFPTALHAIFFRWFYCIYCGTPLRLKK